MQQYQLTVSASDGILNDTAKVTINVSNVNDIAPTASDSSISLIEDMSNTSANYTIKVSDFGVFHDGDAGDTLQSVRIDSLPANGALYLNGTQITAAMISAAGGVTVSVADINAGKLIFNPTDNTDADSTFNFHVSDGVNWSQQGYAASITIDALADAPLLSLAASSSSAAGGLAPGATQVGNGLTLSYYDNVDGLDRTTAASTAKVESVLEATTPTSQSVVTNLGTQLDIPVDDAYSARGLVYLEAGHSYTFTGYEDDTLRLEIGGKTLIDFGHNSWGNYAANFKPDVSGYYSLEMFAYNGDGVGAISLKVAVDNGAAKDLSTANIPLYTDISQVDAAGLQHGSLTAVGDGGYYASTYNHGMLGSSIHLAAITATTPDMDGSEKLSLVMGALPEGSVLSDGTHAFLATATKTSVDISSWNSAQLSLTPPLGFVGTINLQVTATTTEASNGSHATTQGTLTVVVDADSIHTLHAIYTNVASTATGLSGEYFGYNDGNTSVANKTSETGDGSVGNIDNFADAASIIKTRSGLTVGEIDPQASVDSRIDARFVATNLNYGNVLSGNLGNAGGAYYYTHVTSGNLVKFLNNNGASTDGNSVYATNWYGNTSDAVIRMLGSVYFGEGNYQFKVTADDGYKVFIDGVAVVSYDGNAATVTTTGGTVALAEGLHQVEIVFWDQGDAANFNLSFKQTTDSAWSGFNSANLLMLREGYTLSDLQDVVRASDGSWMVRTGQSVTGTMGQALITGSDGRDIIHGAQGNDVTKAGDGADKLYGDLGDDILVGGKGNDLLTGGAGHDTFAWLHGDQGSLLTPAVDHIVDFDKTKDVIDISDLLDHNGEKSADVLKSYLSIGADTKNLTIEVHDPAAASGTSGAVVEKIVLDNVSYDQMTGASGSTAQQVIDYMINNHLLDIDK